MSDANNRRGKPNTPGRPAGNAEAAIRGAKAATELVREVADIFRICADCVKEIEEQRTERTRITETARVQIEEIRARRDVMISFMAQTFAERSQEFRDLFQRLDRAMESNNPENTRAVLDAIVDVAKTSPFAALRDAVSAQAALKDKNITWEF
jgi:hypothetical protein